MVLTAAQVCDEKKATDTRILELDPADAGFTDFFLITSGSNTRQTGAIADEIELRIKREFGAYAKYARSVEGRRSGEWILLDYIDFVVHIFTEQTREFYDIERLRKSARSVAVDELTAELKQRTAAVRGKASAKTTQVPDGNVKPTSETAKEPESLPAPVKKATRKKAAAKKTPAKKTVKKASLKKVVKTRKKAQSASADSDSEPE